MAASTVEPADELGELRGLMYVAVYLAVVSALFALAGRSLRRRSRRHFIWQTLAIATIVLALVPFIAPLP
jgi:hypothetical protein